VEMGALHVSIIFLQNVNTKIIQSGARKRRRKILNLRRRRKKKLSVFPIYFSVELEIF